MTDMISEFDRSGMSGMAFVRHYGIKYQTFVAWLKKRRERSQGNQTGRVNLVEAVIDPADGIALGNGVRVQLPGGSSVEILDQHQAGLVACLIRNLALGSC